MDFLKPMASLSKQLDKEQKDNPESAAWSALTGGSPTEWLVYRWLISKGMTAGVDFAFQADRLGGLSHIGNAKIHFIVYASKLALRVQGIEWPNLTAKSHSLDLLQRVIWEARGYTVLDLLGSEIEENVNRVMLLAMSGRMTAAAENVLR